MSSEAFQNVKTRLKCLLKLRDNVTFDDPIEVKSGFTAKLEWAQKMTLTLARIKESPTMKGLGYSGVIIYQGETKENWPTDGISFINFAQALEEDQISVRLNA